MMTAHIVTVNEVWVTLAELLIIVSTAGLLVEMTLPKFAQISAKADPANSKRYGRRRSRRIGY